MPPYTLIRKCVDMNENNTLEEKVIKLIRKSNIRGGTDNISIACLSTKEVRDSMKKYKKAYYLVKERILKEL